MTEDTQVYELVTAAFSGDRMTVALTEIERRAQRRRGLWVPAMAGLIVVVMLVGFSWWQRSHGTHMTALDSLSAQCMRHWSQLQPALPDSVSHRRPERIFSMGAGPSRMARIFSNGEVLLECLREGDSVKVGSIYFDGGQSPFGLPDNNLRYFGHYGELSYLVGDMPKGSTAVSARLTNGDIVQAQVVGNLFALWHPHASLVGAVLTASGPLGPTATADRPTSIGGVRDDTSLDETCRSWIADEYNGHPVTGLRLIYTRDLAEYQFRAYVSDWTVADCKADQGPNPVLSVGALTATDRPWSQMEPLDYSATGSVPHMFYFGRAPENATRVEMHLADGTVVAAELVGEYFCALVTDRPLSTGVRKVVGYTPTTVFTREGLVTTSRPLG
ncbi:hypothetical protein Rhe02_60130 [Rhizocola hellebori]|uniref:Uncharacterized protein n=1 Tax=Rhizocola hellebori TaxID=1392758 RepID=A0A8J3VJD2_9ACTN|nr:hypothetical protein [Rhizocola hellebori]GIH07946.1 hypothetical protein Rhe02_60130 [Rhizocola hellebori]